MSEQQQVKTPEGWEPTRAVDSVAVNPERLRTLRTALERISEQQQETLAMIRNNGFVFATNLAKPDLTEAERWEKLAFSIYADLCEVDSIAHAALADLDGTE